MQVTNVGHSFENFKMSHETSGLSSVIESEQAIQYSKVYRDPVPLNMKVKNLKFKA